MILSKNGPDVDFSLFADADTSFKYLGLGIMKMMRMQ
jgi:hypothetical protein